MLQMPFDIRSRRHLRSCCKAAVATLTLAGSIGTSAWADEGGTSFWLPGQYGSFAAVAPEPGTSLAMVSYWYSAQANANRPLEFGGNLKLGVDASYFGQFIVPAYTPDTTFLGARPSFSVALIPARNRVSADISVGGASASASDEVTGISDLYPTAQLFWNRGVHNWMAYVTGNIPIGSYDATRLSNLGLGHAAIDIGGAYTFLNPATGWEYSATAGLTYNFKNSDTDYQNGIDFHLDLGASKFVTDRMYVGLVGFAYQQLTADSGQPAVLGDFKGRTYGIGPQIGWILEAGGTEVFANLRAYKEFNVKNRVEGGGVMLTFSMPL
jgi:hypothetical protein